MFFCEKCRYLFNVTKDIKSKQVGGKINEGLTAVLDKFKENKPLLEKDLKNIKGKDLMEDERFEKMSKKEQKKMISYVKSLDKNFFTADDKKEVKIGTSVAYFICKFCKNYRKIEPGTLIYSKNYNVTGSVETEDYTYAIYDQTLPRTANYVCKNPKCSSHEGGSKEAVITKNATDQVVYICTICSTNWISGV